MPVEKFYPSTAATGEPRDHLEIRWGAANSDIHMILEVDGVGAVITLDRASANRMIRTLRHARTSTYGADE